MKGNPHISGALQREGWGWTCASQLVGEAWRHVICKWVGPRGRSFLFLRALRSSPAGWPRIGTVGPIDAVADLNHTGRKPLAALPEEQSSWQVWWRKNGVCRGSLRDNNLDLLSNFSGWTTLPLGS